MTYKDFFEEATGNGPFQFQELFRSATTDNVVLRAHTGLGKTETVLCAWLHRRAAGHAPRRLIWCLPSRALTEQVAKTAESCVKRLSAAGLMHAVPVYRLLGGSDDNKATVKPEEAAIMVGTQDILLSRALNRGYARKPFRWPIDFALLNNDCYWVFDEVQLLGDGLATSAQVAAFRRAFKVFGSAETCWISATLDPSWIRTVDFLDKAPVIEPTPEDFQNEIVRKRIHAEKKVEMAPAECHLPAGAAQFVAAQHQAGTLSLVIANTIRRATEIRRALERKTSADVRLLHSRFRAADRKAQTEAAFGTLPAEGRIIVSTQVIEAGIDLDASLMVTDVAPYGSMVQRFGRVNRKGERSGCRVFWVDRPLTEKRKGWAERDLSTKELQEVYAPYDPAEIEASARILGGLTSAAPADLPKLEGAATPWKHVLRRADLLDLFDTSSDLGGNEVDISRFVRSDIERDAYVAWRDWEGDRPPDKMEELDEGELCPAPIGDFDKNAGKVAWCWEAGTGRWKRPDAIYPGQVLLLHSKEGRYTTHFGWSPDSKTAVAPVAGSEAEMESHNSDANSFKKYRQTLTKHTEMVCLEMRRLLDALRELNLDEYHSSLESAARNHDWGKAHPVMQLTLQGAPGPYEELLAKSEESRKHSVPFFRHELASALALVSAGEDDLAAYVAAAHHGRVRLSIRSMPGERDQGRPRVRGICNGDALLACSLGGGVTRDAAVLNLAPVELGEGSWTERMVRLRDQLGPFRLAYLEMLLRAADETASAGGAA